MKRCFLARLCKDGILGGVLYINTDQITYRTNKITVPQKLKNLEHYFKDIESTSKGRLLCFPTVSFKMKNGDTWKFIVFTRNAFLKNIKSFGIK